MATMMGHIKTASATHQGQRREHNEDYVGHWEPQSSEDEAKHGWIYIVADGVGGADAGEVASEFATEQTLKHYLEDDDNSDWGQRIVGAMQAANTDLRQLVAVRNQNRRMATTMVAAVIQGNHVYLANVGDSRGYRWRDNTLQQITKDQSLVAKLVEEGAITEEEAENHPRKNVILSSVGSERRAQIDLFQVTFHPGDILVLCSDGLTRHVSDAEIGRIIETQTPDTAVNTLIDLANERGGEDNISISLVCHCQREETAVAVADATLTGETLSDSAADIIADATVPDALVASRPAPVVATAPTPKIDAPFLWQYAIFLSIIQSLLILTVWYILRP